MNLWLRTIVHILTGRFNCSLTVGVSRDIGFKLKEVNSGEKSDTRSH